MHALRDIAALQIGYQSGRRIPVVADGPFRIVQAGDIAGDLRVSTAAMLRFVPERDPVRYLVGPDDVLFLARGPHNAAIVPDRELPDTVASNSFFILRPTAAVRPGYLAWWINHPATQLKIAEMVTGSTVPYVRRGDFERLAVAVPPPHVQDAVVALDAARAREAHLLQQLIDARHRHLSALALAAVSGKDG